MSTLVSYDLVGVAGGTVLGISPVGTGDTPPSAVAGTDKDTVHLVKVTNDPGMADCFEIQTTATGQQSFFTWNLPQGRSIGVRFYVKKPGSVWGGTAWNFAGLTGNGLTNTRWAFGGTAAPGTMRSTYAATTSYSATPASTIAFEHWYRVEGYVKPNPNADATTTDGQLRFLVYDGDATTTLYDSGWVTADLNDYVDKMVIGSITATPATPGTVRYAHLKVTDDANTLIGPYGAAPPAPATVKHAGSYTQLETVIGVGVSISGATQVRIRATPTAGGAAVTGPNATVNPSGWVYARVTGLTPGTAYDVEVINVTDGTTVETVFGRTVSSARKNFRAITSSCQRTASDSAIYDVMLAENPDFFAHQGDLHYLDTGDETTWRTGVENALGRPHMKAFLKTVSTTYHYDNHDWGGNTSWRESPCGTFIPGAIRELMGDQRSTWGMESTWVEGGVRFIETDQWAYRDEAVPGGGTSSADDTRVGKTMFGLDQRNWLFDTLLASTEPLIVWFCSFPLYSNLIGNGRWGNFRDEIGIVDAWLTAHPDVKKKIVCVGGDSHSVVADDGTNTMWHLPSLNASPLDRKGDVPGLTSGTWNIASSANPVPTYDRGYYSLMTFTWTGSTVTMKWEAKDDTGAVISTYTKSFTPESTGKTYVKKAGSLAVASGRFVKTSGGLKPVTAGYVKTSSGLKPT